MKKWIIIFIILVLEPWIVSLIRCEVLTAKYCTDDIVKACESCNMLGKIDSIKILDYSEYLCKVYTKEKGLEGDLFILYSHHGAPWEILVWDTIWSYGGGNADGFIWPYIR